MSSGNEVYRFDIANNQVIGVFKFDDGRWKDKTFDRDGNKTYSLEGNDVIRTETDYSGVEITRFSDTNGDGLFSKISKQWQNDINPAFRTDFDGSDSNDRSSSNDFHENGHKAYQFDIANNQVVRVLEFDDGGWKDKTFDHDGNKTYVVEGSDVIRTETKHSGIEITRYADTDGDGLFNRVSEQWQGQSTDGFRVRENLRYDSSGSDDLIAVRAGDDSYGGLGSDDFVIREAAHLRIGDFDANEGDSLVFDTGFGLTSIDDLANFVTGTRYDGQDFIVDFGSDTSITLVGVQPDQIGWNNVEVLS